MRRAGVLLHVSALPGPFGIGDFGPEARRFVETLAAAGQTLWQIMPLGPPGPGNSPYAARSTFGVDPLLVSLEDLAEDGLLDRACLANPPFAPGRIDFDRVHAWKEGWLREAYQRFAVAPPPPEFAAFVAEVGHWLPDFALFMALRAREEGRSWSEWPDPIRRRETEALAVVGAELVGEVRFQTFVQWAAHRQWRALRRYANARGVGVVGDVPIFVDYDSADVWAHQHLFKLNARGYPAVVAGVPPDAFSATGQRWGNPLYDWEAARADGYRWWIDRFGWALGLVDLLRVDHFRGFESAWEIPADEPTAERGCWVPGPGRELFEQAATALGPLSLIAEDLGVITPQVRALRDGLGYPGMKILQFAFGDDARNPYLPHNLSRLSVVYTGTHDNDTTVGWLATLGEVPRGNLQRYLGKHAPGLDDLVRMAYGAVSETAILPMQDVLRLGSEARTNRPGEPEGNWSWRFSWEQLEPARVEELRALAETYGRYPPQPEEP
ncbi:MAG: 4-alpha-glucanotransferase [Dehalococcoidia bacterium]|nr:4-alpha-glucanotransferase [Dehalococcoidia bacterium]